jgi:transcription elongation factor Elf1
MQIWKRRRRRRKKKRRRRRRRSALRVCRRCHSSRLTQLHLAVVQYNAVCGACNLGLGSDFGSC